jgi:hypothetical protein
MMVYLGLAMGGGIGRTTEPVRRLSDLHFQIATGTSAKSPRYRYVRDNGWGCGHWHASEAAAWQCIEIASMTFGELEGSSFQRPVIVTDKQPDKKDQDRQH